MSGYQKVIICGRFGQDPEIRYTSGGSAVANFSLATSERWKDKNTGDPQEKTEWHRCVAFGKTAELIGQYLQKGKQLLIEGKLQTRKWVDNDGQNRYTTEVVVREMSFIDSGKGGSQESQHRQAPTSQKASRPAGPDDDFDEDIPF